MLAYAHHCLLPSLQLQAPMLNDSPQPSSAHVEEGCLGYVTFPSKQADGPLGAQLASASTKGCNGRYAK